MHTDDIVPNFLLTAVLSVTNSNNLNDSDSGIGAGAADVIVFGTDLELPELPDLTHCKYIFFIINSL